jgi:hypothetical protein
MSGAPFRLQQFLDSANQVIRQAVAGVFLRNLHIGGLACLCAPFCTIWLSLVRN